MTKKSWLEYKLESASAEELKELSDKAAEKLFGAPERLVELAHIAEYEEEAKEYVKNWGKVSGLTTGLNNVDALTKGLDNGELIVVGGETSHGKTALAVNMAVRLATQGHVVLFVTLEIPQKQLAARIMKISEKPLPELPILVQKLDEFTWQDVDKLIQKAKKENVAAVFIDHLHYFTRELEKIAEDLGRITKEFKKNAIRHDLPVVLISHVRKKAPGSKKLGNDDLRGSSYIAQDADIVLFVERGKEEIRVTITKNRNRGFDMDAPTTALYFDGARVSDYKIPFA